MSPVGKPAALNVIGPVPVAVITYGVMAVPTIPAAASVLVITGTTGALQSCERMAYPGLCQVMCEPNEPFLGLIEVAQKSI